MRRIDLDNRGCEGRRICGGGGGMVWGGFSSATLVVSAVVGEQREVARGVEVRRIDLNNCGRGSQDLR